MICTLCMHLEEQKLSDGRIKECESSDDVIKIICGNCVQVLLAAKMGDIPWDREIQKKVEDDGSQLKRRKMMT